MNTRTDPHRSPAHAAAGGFTLIELLVVISIIALLIGILLPSLAAAREQARTTLSLSNAHQIALGLNLYATDYKGEFPSTAHTGVTWMEQIGLPAIQTLADFGGDTAAYDAYVARVTTATKYVHDPRAFLSPKDTSPFIKEGAAPRRWTSYGLNSYFTYDHPPYYGIKLDAVVGASHSILITEYRNEDTSATDPWEDHLTPQFFGWTGSTSNVLSGFVTLGPYNPANPVDLANFPYPPDLGAEAEGAGFSGTIDFTEDANLAWDNANNRPNSTLDAKRYNGRWPHGFVDGHANLQSFEETLVWPDHAQPPSVNWYDPKASK